MAKDRASVHHDPDEHQRVQHLDQSRPVHQGSVTPQNTPSPPTSLLGDPRLSGRGNGSVRQALVQGLQQTYSNRALQRLLAIQRTPHSSTNIITTPTSNPSACNPSESIAEAPSLSSDIAVQRGRTRRSKAGSSTTTTDEEKDEKTKEKKSSGGTKRKREEKREPQTNVKQIKGELSRTERKRQATAGAGPRWQEAGENGKGIETEEGQLDFTHYVALQKGRSKKSPVYTYYWRSDMGSEDVYESVDGGPATRINRKGAEVTDIRRRLEHPAQSARKRKRLDKQKKLTEKYNLESDEVKKMGIGAPRGAGGNRTYSGKGHKFHVRGVSDRAKHYMKQFDDWTEDAEELKNLKQRISYGGDVPTLASSVPIDPQEVGDTEEGEELPKGFEDKNLGTKEVKGNYIDKDFLNRWSGKRKVDSNPQQGKAMEWDEDVEDPSATKEAVRHGFPAEVGGHGWEWLHLVAYSMGGHAGYPQYSGNLVLGTWHANSAHLAIEEAVKELARSTREVIRVNPTATYFEDTPIGWEIQYEISTSSGRSITFTIDCLMRVRPTSHDQKYYFMILADKLLSPKTADKVMKDKVAGKLKKTGKEVEQYEESSSPPASPAHYNTYETREEFDSPKMYRDYEEYTHEELEKERTHAKGKLGVSFHDFKFNKGKMKAEEVEEGEEGESLHGDSDEEEEKIKGATEDTEDEEEVKRKRKFKRRKLKDNSEG